MKKSTKIIGAVLGVLLVAALFVGAGAAAEVKTVEVGESITVPLPTGYTLTAVVSDYITAAAAGGSVTITGTKVSDETTPSVEVKLTKDDSPDIKYAVSVSHKALALTTPIADVVKGTSDVGTTKLNLGPGSYTIEGDGRVIVFDNAANLAFTYATEYPAGATYPTPTLDGNVVKVTVTDMDIKGANIGVAPTTTGVGHITITKVGTTEKIEQDVTVYPNGIYYGVDKVTKTYAPGELITITAYNATTTPKADVTIMDTQAFTILEKVGVTKAAPTNTIASVGAASVIGGKIEPGKFTVQGSVAAFAKYDHYETPVLKAAGTVATDINGDGIVINITPQLPDFVFGAQIISGQISTIELGSGPINIGDFYVWELYPAAYAGTTWTSEDKTTTVEFKEDPGNAGMAYLEGDAVGGKYTWTPKGTNVTLSMNVKHLGAPTGYVVKNVPDALGNYEAVAGLSGATVDVDSFYIKVPGKVAWTNPAGSIVTTDPSELGIKTVTSDIFNAADAYDFGEYTIAAAALKTDTDTQGNLIYSSLAPSIILGEPVTFELKSLKDSTSLKALSEEILQGDFVTIAITAPYGDYKVSVDEAIIPKGQVDVAPNGAQTEATVKVGFSGEAAFVVKSNTSNDVKVKLYKAGSTTNVDKTVTIKVKAGEIKADSSAAAYIGNEVKITGTNELGGSLTLFIKGPNFKFAEVTGAALAKSPSGKEWEAKINTGELKSDSLKKPDAGNYTIYVAKLTTAGVAKQASQTKLTASDLDDSTLCDAYTTVVVALKQPFISITEAPAVVVQGDNLYVKGTAEGQPGLVRWYVFGTNFFASQEATVDDDGVFEIDEKIVATDGQWQAGQYFLVVQHPMYDKKFNVGPKVNGTGKGGFDIVKNESGTYTTSNNVIFNTNERQSANAAQALCDALDDQNIDDMYVKASFFVAGPSSVIGAIPEQVTKGEALTISGVAIGHKKEVVSVELLSTAFAAVPKETVGSASFVSAVARIDDDGLWTVTIDTSDLNADDYTVSVSVGSLDPATQKIKIVEGSVTPQPTPTSGEQPTAQPTGQPTQTPASPGFGILAALAGLGAVAVLLLRRQ